MAIANKNKKVKFTVMIPTREHWDVLGSALKTCTTQDYDNFEIIVSDAFSQDKTREVVESFKDKRIRYINTGKRVSLTDNCEFALSHAEGDYITYIGDDDALIPGALAELNEIIKQTGSEAVSCRTAEYSWPDHIDEAKRNLLRVPLGTSLVKRYPKKMMVDVINFRRLYEDLPMLYRSFISHNAIKRVMHESGKFFHSMNTDAYSGFALACVLESSYHSFKPFVICGASRHSMGASDRDVGNYSESWKKYISESNVPFHSKLVLTIAGDIIIAEAFLQAQEHLSYAKRFELDIRKCIRAAITEAAHCPKKKYDMVVEAVKKIAHMHKIEPYALRLVAAHKNKPARFFNPVLGFNIARNHLIVNCTEFRVRDVYEASILCGHILALEKLRYHSMNGVIKTTLSYLKREIRNKSLISTLLKRH